MRKGFSLVECIAAIALFALGALVLGQACFNCINSISLLKKDSQKDAFYEQVRVAVLQETNFESLQSGITIYDPDRKPIKIYGEATSTSILDLFILKVHCESEEYKDYSDTFYLIRPEWYSQVPALYETRDDILTDRKDFISTQRRASIFK